MNGETWLILGGSSSVARELAGLVAEDGCQVMLAGRDMDDLDRTASDLRIRHGVAADSIAFDATAYDDHDRFVAECTGLATGRLNIFLAFGFMPEQAAIDRDFDLARRTIEASYLGAVSVLSRFAPAFESQAGGHIVALGSVAGDRGRRKNYVYGSAKAGLHAYLQGLRARLFDAGVTVTTVKPGFLDTAMTWGQPGMFLVASPRSCARACLKFAQKGAEIRYFPWFWWGIMTILKSIPERVFKKLNV